MVGMYTVSINIEYEFNKLVDDEFKISRDLCSLKCVDSVDYFYDRYQEEYVNTCDCISSMMTEMLNCTLYRYAVAHTSFFGEHDDRVKFTVYFPKERIIEIRIGYHTKLCLKLVQGPGAVVEMVRGVIEFPPVTALQSPAFGVIEGKILIIGPVVNKVKFARSTQFF